ncbi:hypothetical protein TNCV_1361331 [Trichonephila clavipes]|nr:hypothetical protein TNCV_1361331 [Trichonephila clavipes]
MTSANFLHHENPPTWTGIKPTNLGAEDLQETNNAANLNLREKEREREMEYEFRFCLQHQDGCIRVWRHWGERALAAPVLHRHAGPLTGVVVWATIGYTSRSSLVRSL